MIQIILIARKKSNKNLKWEKILLILWYLVSHRNRRERGTPSSISRAKRVIMRLRCKSRLTRKKDRIGAQPNHCSVNAPFVPFVRDTTRLFLCFENRSRLCATASKYQSMANNKCNKRTSKLSRVRKFFFFTRFFITEEKEEERSNPIENRHQVKHL